MWVSENKSTLVRFCEFHKWSKTVGEKKDIGAFEKDGLDL